jgi:hypothetical protein
MKNFINDFIKAFPTSKKHMIGFVFAFFAQWLFSSYNLMGWNEFVYNDKYFFTNDFTTPLWLGQSIAVLIIGYFCNGAFEYLQQRNLEEKPTWKDTQFDCYYFAIFAWLGYIVNYIIF